MRSQESYLIKHSWFAIASIEDVDQGVVEGGLACIDRLMDFILRHVN